MRLRNFMLSVLLVASTLLFGQSPGSLFVNAGEDQTITCGSNGCVDLTATYLETFETDGAQYSVSAINYEPPFSFNGLANQLNPNIDDAWSAVDQLPFDFCFFGDLVDEFQVGSNGILRFEVDPSDTYNAWSFSQNLPNNTQEALSEGNVFLPVHDIDPSQSSNEQIGYEVLGTYPNRVLVVSYYQVPYYSCTNLRATHMAVFYEFSNIIDVYIENSPSCPGWNPSGNPMGSTALGIQNNAGTVAYVPPGRNTLDSPWSTSDEAWRFAPVGEETYEFAWLDSDGNVISTNPTINVCETGTYTARVIYTNTCNNEVYTVTDDVVVTSSQPFNINLGEDVETCELQEIVLDASDGAPAGALYEWFYNDVSQGPPSAANPTFTVVAPNSGTYKVEVTDPADPTCVVTDEVEITFDDLFAPEFTIQTVYCLNATPEDLPDNSVNGFSGTWSPAVIDTSELGITTYTFTPDAGQCADIFTIDIEITELLDSEFTLETTYCLNSTPEALPALSNNGFSGTWSPAVIDTSELGTTTYTFTPDPEQCADVFTIEIEITDLLLSEFDLTDTYCLNSTPDTLPPNSNNGYSGTWNPAVIDTSVMGTTTYTFTPDDECVAVFEFDINVTDLIQIEFTYDNEYCEGEIPQILEGTSTNGITGSWMPSTIDTGLIGDTNYTFTPDPDQCAGELVLTITVYPQPVLNTVPTIELCDDDFDGIFTTDLTDLNAQLGGGTGITYEYYASLADFNSDIPIPTGQWNNYNFPSLPATIYVVGESGEGCRSAEIPVQFIAGEEVNHNAGPFGPIEYCPEDTVDLTQFVGAIGSGGATLAYFNTIEDARNQTNEILNTTEFTPAQTQTSVIVRLDEAGFCSAFVEILLERLATPSLELSHTSMVLCEDDSFEATATSDDPNATYEWTLGDGTILTGPIQTIDQIGTYTVIAYSADGCRSEERTLTVNLPSIPVISGLELGDNFIIVSATNNGEGPLEYSLDGVLWQSSPQFSNLIPGETYTVWVRSSGCMIQKYDVTILSVPNFISPNGDGKNDTWTIRGINATPGATIKIFDRYGKIFVDTNFEGDYEWNGKYLGNNVPSGDYWYIIQVPSDGIVQERKFVGHITVRNR